MSDLSRRRDGSIKVNGDAASPPMRVHCLRVIA